MDFEKHPACNFVFNAPASWDRDGPVKCDPLPARIGELPGGVPVIESFWRPGPGELAALNERGYVVLQIIGRGMPPVAVGVTP